MLPLMIFTLMMPLCLRLRYAADTLSILRAVITFAADYAYAAFAFTPRSQFTAALDYFDMLMPPRFRYAPRYALLMPPLPLIF